MDLSESSPAQTPREPREPERSDPATGWSRRLFVERPEVYLPFLEAADGRAEAEVQALIGLFGQVGVGEGARVLDVACGVGRHAIRLARRGFRVTGIDLSPLYIGLAEKAGMRNGVEVEWIVGDAADASELLDGPFDAFISMFTSIGYAGRDSDLRLLKGLRRLAAPGAALILEVANRDYLVRAFQAETLDVAGATRVYQKRRLSPDGESLLSDWHFFRETATGDGPEPVLHVPMEHRLYDTASLAGLLAQAGWSVQATYGVTADAPGRLGPVGVDSKSIWMAAIAPQHEKAGTATHV